jgi:hypothetical protein
MRRLTGIEPGLIDAGRRRMGKARLYRSRLWRWRADFRSVRDHPRITRECNVLPPVVNLGEARAQNAARFVNQAALRQKRICQPIATDCFMRPVFIFVPKLFQ